MKKIVISIVVVISLCIGLLIFRHNKGHGSRILAQKEYTPQELWQMAFDKKREKRRNGYTRADKPREFAKYFQGITTKFGETESGYDANYKLRELNKAIQRNKKLKTGKSALPWVCRGPGNIAGRTRAIIVDPDDATCNTWFVGTCGGGIWKTTNAGNTWIDLTPTLANLTVVTMAMPESSTNIIYAGTGEYSGSGGAGSGIFKSTDKGLTWLQLPSTINDDFTYVNRLVVHPEHGDTVLAATLTGIFKSVDGGTSWTKVYTRPLVEEIVADPQNFNTLYAGVNGLAVVKSINGGDTWQDAAEGIGKGKRFELAVSAKDPDYVYASVEVSEDISHVYMSPDKAVTWYRFEDDGGNNENFLGGQGDYDNTIAVHPFDSTTIFVGGVDIWKLTFDGAVAPGYSEVSRVDTINTSFLSFVNFGGNFLGGGMETGDAEESNATDIVPSDWVSVEIRFGPGQSQKAHRFTVPVNGGTNGDGGAGVPPDDYSYQDYVDVPFEVWDVTNNRQLMASFRDQERDGAYNLLHRDETNDVPWREYLFVNAVSYNASTPSPNIAKAGGHMYKTLYFFWPVLSDSSSWDPDNLPDSRISITYSDIQLKIGTTANISDAYNHFSGNNTYGQSMGQGTTSIPGLHPDHHNLTLIPINEGSDIYTILNGNDGGLAISYDRGVTFTQIKTGFITTQFYGVAKKPGANEYFGGTQDNGSWQSPIGKEATDTSKYYFRLTGDGFEALWHADNPSKILGSIYYNLFYLSTNGGLTWTVATTNIQQNDGPFISRLTNSIVQPDVVFAVGAEGVYKSSTFGASTWQMRRIDEGWAPNGITHWHTARVSLANHKYIWAGAAMASDYGYRISLSKNQGLTFEPINDYDLVPLNGYISGIATHPCNDSIAYVMSALRGEPKILRTEDLGQTWEDITGFGTNDSSSNGFPDVLVLDLLVMPHNTDILWAATDIGIFESTDNGVSWHYADNGLPATPIFMLRIVDDQIIAATHGRGIWSVQMDEINNIPLVKSALVLSGIITMYVKINANVDSLAVFMDDSYRSSIVNASAGIHSFNCSAGPDGTKRLRAIAYSGGKPYKSNVYLLTVLTTAVDDVFGDETGNSIRVYPNPSFGEANVGMDNDYTGIVTIIVYDITGKIVYSTTGYKPSGEYVMSLDLHNQKNGQYIVKIGNGIYQISKLLTLK